MIGAIISSASIVIVAIVGVIVRFERRLTRVETKLDLLLNHNGINPGEKKKDG